SGVTVFLARMHSVPRKVQLLYSAHWCQSEVENGGFYQFFSNTTGIVAPEAQEGFVAVGLPDCAKALAEAMNYFGSHYPRNRSSRLDQLPKQQGKRSEWDPFLPQDKRFYACVEAERHRWAHAADAFAASA